MSIHILLFAKYSPIREELVYKLYNVGIYYQILSRLCSGEVGQYNGRYMDVLWYIVFKSFRNKSGKKAKENIIAQMKKFREIEIILHSVELADEHGYKLKNFLRNNNDGLSKLGLELKDKVRCHCRFYK